jgi:hypothetical protein
VNLGVATARDDDVADFGEAFDPAAIAFASQARRRLWRPPAICWRAK